MNKCVQTVESSSKPSGRRGKDRREKHSFIKKSNVIDDFEAGMDQDVIAEHYSINRSLVSKWVKDKARINEMAVSNLRETFKKRPSQKYKTVYTELLKRFKAAREKGRYVNFGWLWSKARVISGEQGGGEIRRHVVVNFLKRFNIRMRAKQRNRKQPKGAYREALIKWHSTTRERLVRTGFEDEYDD